MTEVVVVAANRHPLLAPAVVPPKSAVLSVNRSVANAVVLVARSIPFRYAYCSRFHSIPFHFISFHSISFHSISFHSISFHFIPFHFIMIQILFRHRNHDLYHTFGNTHLSTVVRTQNARCDIIPTINNATRDFQNATPKTRAMTYATTTVAATSTTAISNTRYACAPSLGRPKMSL